MKRIFSFLLFLSASLAVSQLSAQSIDRSFVFVDDNGTEIADGATVVCNNVEMFEEGVEVIYSGISVKRTDDATAEHLCVHYTISRLDNGSYQLCFPITCAKQETTGTFVTSIGKLMTNPQSIQSEWFPTADGSCIVNLNIEVMAQVPGSFPPQYQHKADGPSLTLQFEKGGSLAGDVNGDGNVNVSDINVIIQMILSGNGGTQGDVNGDGNVNISDINAVIGLILNH